MRIHKVLLLLAISVILGGTISSFGQDSCKVENFLNKTQLNELEKAVKIYWDAQTNEENKKAVEALEQISAKEPDNWVAAYWVSYISTQVLNGDKEGKEGAYFGKAKEYIEKADKAFAKKPENSAVPYFHALRSLIYGFESRFLRQLQNTAKADEMRVKSTDELNKGIQLSPQNPVLMVLAATSVIRRDEVNYGSNLAATALFEKAQAEFKKIENRSPADITYWNEHWIKFWLGRVAIKKP